MARIRSVHPSLLVSEDIADLSIGCQMHFVRLWVVADDAGRGKDRSRWLKGVAWPIQDDVSVDQIEAWQAELAEHGRIVRYEAKGEQWWQIVNFCDYQRPSRPTVSKIPPPPDEASVEPSDTDREAPEASPTPPDPHVQLREDSRVPGGAHESPSADREGSGIGVGVEGRGVGRGDPTHPPVHKPVDKPQATESPPDPTGGEPTPATNAGGSNGRQRSRARTERDRAKACWHQEVAPAITCHGRSARWRDLTWGEPRIPDVITSAGGWTALCNMAPSDAEKAFTTAWTKEPART